jgi:hypothetical protein
MGEFGVGSSECGIGSEEAEGEEGCYVYGVAGENCGGALLNLDVRGIDPEYPIHAMPRRDLLAVVSTVSMREFGLTTLQSNLKDIRWLAEKARAHEAVLEAASNVCTLVPMRFCTIYPNEDRVREILDEHHDVFSEALARLDGKREWGVKCFCDREILAEKARETSEKYREMQSDAAQRSSGAAYFLKKKLDETAAAEAERLSDECAHESHSRLSQRASESALNRLHDRDLTGRKDEMILNGAYLVSEDSLSAFRDELAALSAEYGEMGLSCELTGPWPAYNFAAIGAQEASCGAVGA